MITNALITGWRRCTGTTGAGAAVLEDVAIRHGLPCEMVNPSDFRVASAQSVGVALERLIRVRAAALRIAGINPRPEDRAQLHTLAPFVEDMELEVTGVKPLGLDRQYVEIAFGVRRDGA